MATKVIKLNNGLTGDNAVTYVPVTVASAVQYSYTGGVMSVQDALGTVASALLPHFEQKDYLSYNSTDGFKLSGVHGEGNVKMVPGTGISFSYTTGGNLTIASTADGHAQGVDNQHLSASATSNVGTISLDGNGGNVTIGALSNPTSTGSATAHVEITYNSGLKLNVTYTDTNTVFTGSADASSTTTASTPSETNGMIGVIQKVASNNGTSFTTTQYVGVPSKDYVDNAVSTALTSALKYKGTVASNTELTGKTKTQGDVWVVSTAGNYTVTSNGSTTATSQHLEPGDYLICNGTTWDAVNGENQVSDGTGVLEVPYTTTAGTAATVATVDGTNLTLAAKHASVSYTSSALTDLTPAHGGNFTVIGNIEVSNGHVTKLHTQKVTLPNETQLSKTGTDKTTTLTHGGTFTYISNLNVSNHAITYDYTTATLPSQGPDYGQIKVIKHSSATTDSISSSASDVTLLSKNDNELVTFESVNKWLHIKGTESTTAGSDKVQFSHALSGAGAKTTADVYSIKIDAAGHITEATAASTGTVGLTSMKYKVGNTVDDINDAALGLTFGNDLNVAELTGDTTFVK